MTRKFSNKFCHCGDLTLTQDSLSGPGERTKGMTHEAWLKKALEEPEMMNMQGCFLQEGNDPCLFTGKLEWMLSNLVIFCYSMDLTSSESHPTHIQSIVQTLILSFISGNKTHPYESGSMKFASSVNKTRACAYYKSDLLLPSP